MNQAYNTSELQHIGVKGMKWGIRRANAKTQSLSKSVGKTIRKFDKGRNLPEGHIQTCLRRLEHKSTKLIVRQKGLNVF